MDTLSATADGWAVQGVCPGGGCAWDIARDFSVQPGPRKVPMDSPPLRDEPGTLTEEVSALTSWWRAHDPVTTRIPFLPVLVSPDGRPVVLTRGSGGSGQVFTGGRALPVAIPPSPSSWPGWFTLHPSGREAYVLAWPSGVLRAFDPVGLVPRWTVDLGGAATGLFLAAGGRFLLAVTGPGTTERLVDWPIRALEGDPTADEWLRIEPRPPADAVVVVDVATRTRLARVPGKYRRFLARPDGTLLVATDREIATIRPPPPG